MRSQSCNCNDLTEVQITQSGHYDDRPARIAGVVPPLESPPLQSLSEAESTRLEGEDYNNAN